MKRDAIFYQLFQRFPALLFTVPLLLKNGITVEQIAERLKVEVEVVRRASEGNS